MTRCKQCHLDGHHKMSCTDESNAAREGRATVPTGLTEPIVDGAYYEREDGCFVAHSFGDVFRIGSGMYYPEGKAFFGCAPLTRRVYLVPTNPAEVVAELRRRANICAPSGGVPTVAVDNDGHVMSLGIATVAYMLSDAADLVAKKLGVE